MKEFIYLSIFIAFLLLLRGYFFVRDLFRERQGTPYRPCKDHGLMIFIILMLLLSSTLPSLLGFSEDETLYIVVGFILGGFVCYAIYASHLSDISHCENDPTFRMQWTTRPDGYWDVWRIYVYPDGSVRTKFLGVDGHSFLGNIWILIRRINTPATEPSFEA